MKVSVCASITYYYTVDVPDELCNKDKNGYLKNEAELLDFCCNADPINFSGVNDIVTGDIISIRNDATDEELYFC